MTLALLLALAYLIGSIPSAYIVGRLKGIDVRTVGSGNMGATNIYRTLGAWPAIVVLVADAGKGAMAATLLPNLVGAFNSTNWGFLFGVVAMVGHSRPIFLGFKSGGKGVATAGGVFAALAPVAFAGGLAGFVVTVALTRYVSLGSLLAAAILPIACAATHGIRSIAFLAAAAVTVFVFWSHRSNIQRLRRGEERRIGRPGTGANAAGEARGAPR